MSLRFLNVAILVVLANFIGGQVRAGEMYFCFLKSGVGGLSRDSRGDEVENKSE